MTSTEAPPPLAAHRDSAAPPSSCAVPSGARAAPRGERGLRGPVLVVDDDVHVRRVARRVLVHAGFDVIEAASGEEAVALMGPPGARVAVVVLDVTMPGMDGPACAGALRRVRPGLPVLYCSGFAADGALVGVGDPTTGFLAKPYRHADLVERVDALLARCA